MIISELLKLEIKLLLRTKRSLFLTIFTLLMYIIVLFLLSGDKRTGNDFSLFSTILVITLCVYGYCNFLVAWEGSYFDLLMASYIPIKQYIEAKYLLHLIFILLGILMAIPVLFLNPALCIYFGVAFLYHIAVSIPLMIYMAQYNREKIDLINGSFIVDGINGYQYLSGFLIIAPPTGLYYYLSIFFKNVTALLILGVIFLLIGLFYKKVINILTNAFIHQKYALLDSFSK